MIALDPLLEGGVGLTEFLIVVLKTAVAFGLLLGSVIVIASGLYLLSRERVRQVERELK